MQILKESMITPQHQYDAPCPPSKMKDEIKMKVEIRHLKQMKHPNAYPTIPGNY